VREGEETAVFVANGEKAERRVVVIGLTDGMDVEIVSGVKEGEMVIVDGQAGLPDGAKITREAAEEDDEEPAEKADDKGAGSKDGK
jgi:multidrug efflux pump subunit AcrA (membrane-fusion protein)